MSKWIVVEVGCIECGLQSHLVGVFTDEDNARAIAREMDARGHSALEYEVFPYPEAEDTVARNLNAR